ncbi:MAG TPA: ribonuclease HII [Pyrinomonadaceae bacterium]|nr:ribonuclease HII [Pyrinomonadaceae bacterium]
MRNAERKDSARVAGSSLRVLLNDPLVTAIGLDFERQAHLEGFRFVAGVDEVGRGCIAGPVVASACILDIERPLPKGLDDSKKVSSDLRFEIAEELKTHCIAYAIGRVEADEIDRINILEATKKAMLMAIEALRPAADYLLIDALRLKLTPLPQKALIKGDSISASIAAASILAKTYRDHLMTGYDTEFPMYGFADHKGYGATSHYQAINDHGPCLLHRMSFKGVRNDTATAPSLF